MSYIGTTEIGKMFLGSVEIDKAYLGNDLVFSSDVAPDPLQFINYIETDGVAYINTKISGRSPRSCEMKYMPVLTSSTTSCGVLGTGNLSTQDANLLSMFYCYTDTVPQAIIGFAFYYRYLSGGPSVINSATNSTPFEIRSSMQRSSQNISVKQDGESSWTTFSKTNSSRNVGSTNPQFLFALNNGGSPSDNCPSGSRVYYCKIYGDATYSNLVFDGVPCKYYGEYGLWDNVSNSFFGNAASSGAFTGA